MSGSEKIQQQLVIDAGPQGPGWAGHGHADALSVQLSAGGKAILVDPGTFTYVTVDGERARFRETASHSTVQIDGVSQAEPAGAFKWAPPAHASVERWITGERFDFFAGFHRGYRRLSSPVLHKRSIFYLKPHFWLVRDVLEGAGDHEISISWNFAPGALSTSGNEAHFVGEDGATLTALFAAPRDFKHEVLQSWYSPRYGERKESPLLRISANVRLPIEAATMLLTGQPKSAQLELIEAQPRDHAGAPVHGYRFANGRESHDLFFSDSPGKWTAGRICSDARVVCVSSAQGDDLRQFVICDGSYLEMNGRRIFTSDTPVAKREWSSRSSFLLTDAARSLEQPICAGSSHSGHRLRLV
jgi:hypothetical protein